MLFGNFSFYDLTATATLAFVENQVQNVHFEFRQLNNLVCIVGLQAVSDDC